MATKKASTPAAAIGMSHDESKWRAEEDMRTLARAEEVKNDPKRLAAAKAMAREKLAELQAIAK